MRPSNAASPRSSSPRRRGTRLVLCLVALVAGAARADVPAGPERILVSDPELIRASDPDVALAPSGRRALVVWTESSPQGSRGPIAGVVLQGDGLETVLRAVSIGDPDGFQHEPRAAVDGAGRFAVVWRGGQLVPCAPPPAGCAVTPGGDGSGSGVYLRRLAADGKVKGSAVQVNREAFGNQEIPHVAAAGDGRLAVVWEESGSAFEPVLRFTTFDAEGRRAVRPRKLPVADGGFATLFDLWRGVAAGPDFFSVAWNEGTRCEVGNRTNVAVAHVGWDGATLAGPARFRDGDAEPCNGPIALGILGSSRGPLALLVGSNYNFARFSPETGARPARRVVFAELRCAAESCEQAVAVAGDDRGRFVVVWEQSGPSGHSLFAELYGRDGRRRGERFAVSVEVSSAPETPAAALAEDGTLMVVWRRDSPVTGQALVARRFELR